MSNRGSILAMTLTFALGFTMLGLAILQMTGTSNRYAVSKTESSQAFWMAEAGLQRAVWEYKNNSCANFVQQGTVTACTNCTCAGKAKTLAASIGSSGDYDILINNINSKMQSTGSYPNRTSPLAKRTVHLESSSAFTNAAFAKGQMTIGNNVTVDSYNSNLGPYGGGNQFSTGGVASNGTSAGIINLGQNAIVKGDASTGPGGTIVYGNANTQVLGTITHTNSVVILDISVPSIFNGTPGGTLTISGTPPSMGTGNYQYTNISMSNNSVWNIAANSTVNIYLTAATAFSTGNGITINIPSTSKLIIYTDGTFIFGNNPTINNLSQIASNFYIYSTLSSAGNGVQLSNNGTTALAIKAPNTGVLINNNGNVYGAIIGARVTVSGTSNSFVHFDQALIDPPLDKWLEDF